MMVCQSLRMITICNILVACRKRNVIRGLASMIGRMENEREGGQKFSKKLIPIILRYRPPIGPQRLTVSEVLLCRWSSSLSAWEDKWRFPSLRWCYLSSTARAVPACSAAATLDSWGSEETVERKPLPYCQCLQEYSTEIHFLHNFAQFLQGSFG